VKITEELIVNSSTDIRSEDEVMVGWNTHRMRPKWKGSLKTTSNPFTMFGYYVDGGSRIRDVAIRYFGVGNIDDDIFTDFYYLSAPGGVYALVDVDRIVYIGYSTGLMQRLGTHVGSKKKKFTSIWYLSGLGDWDQWGDQRYACDHKGAVICDCPNDNGNQRAWKDLETALIEKFKPIYNNHHKIILEDCFKGLV